MRWVSFLQAKAEEILVFHKILSYDIPSLTYCISLILELNLDEINIATRIA